MIPKTPILLRALGLKSLLLAFLFVSSARSQSPPYDILFTDAHVIDGTGNPWFLADVAIFDGKIAAIGSLKNHPAKRTIDAKGLTLTPGFIDMMSGTTLPLLLDPASAQSKLRQGITTMMAGEGDSLAPQNERTIIDLNLPGNLPHWTNFEQYDRMLAAKGLGLNVVHNVGAAQVRRVVIGDEDRDPTADQLAQMKTIVAKAMQDGAVGLSTALIYPPGTYAKTEEIIELAKIAAQYDGVYFSHMRNESGQLLNAINETIRIGKEAKIPVHIYHLKAAGQENWPLMTQAIDLIRSARASGIDVTADIYPYIRNGIGLGFFVNPRHYAKGTDAFLASLSDTKVRAEIRKEIETTSDWENWYQHVGKNWDNVLVVQVPPKGDKRFEGKSVQEIAALRRVDVWTAFFDLVQLNNVDVDPKSMDENQKDQALRTDFVSVGSDAEPQNADVSTYAHPRTFGTFPRILAKYVREEHVMPLETAIREMTSLPSNQLKLRDRGRISPGMAADVVLFDPAKIQDTATFAKPISYAQGIDYLVVNGQLVIDQAQPTNATPGQILRAPR